MGTSYATAWFRMPCPECGQDVKADAQFYPTIGRFKGDMQTVHQGDRLYSNSGSNKELLDEYGLGEPFPTIQLWEGRAYGSAWCDTCAPGSDGPYRHHTIDFDCVVQIKKGIFTGVLYPIPEEYKLTTGTVNPKKAKRRQAISEEEGIRWRKAAIKRVGNDPMRLMGEALAYPLRRELLYSPIYRNPTHEQILEMAKNRMKDLRGISDLVIGRAT